MKQTSAIVYSIITCYDANSLSWPAILEHIDRWALSFIYYMEEKHLQSVKCNTQFTPKYDCAPRSWSVVSLAL